MKDDCRSATSKLGLALPLKDGNYKGGEQRTDKSV